MNIEELAREVYIKESLENYPQWKENEFTGMLLKDLNRFLVMYTETIVERCAKECATHANTWPDDGKATAGVIASAIRNLLED